MLNLRKEVDRGLKWGWYASAYQFCFIMILFWIWYFSDLDLEQYLVKYISSIGFFPLALIPNFSKTVCLYNFEILSLVGILGLIFFLALITCLIWFVNGFIVGVFVFLFAKGLDGK